MPSALESVFEFLFKYRPLVYSKGEFAFAAPSSAAQLVTIALIAGVLISLTYAWVRAASTRRDRVLLATSRLALLAILGFCLMRPSLSVSSLVEQRGFLAVLIDDSRSMRLRDDANRTRAVDAQELFGGNAELRADLERRFRVRYYGFAERATLVEPDSLKHDGVQTDLGTALEHVTQDMSGLPLAGVILLSDGADNSQRDLGEALLPLRASGVPVFTIGVGKESGPRDVQVSRVALPASVLAGATVVADVELRHEGFGGETVRVEVADAGRLLVREDVQLARGTNYTSVQLPLEASEAGARELKVRVVPLRGETLTENNERAALLEVRNGREKVLLVEGEPRFETKFLRQSLKDEPHIQLVVLQRTAAEKFVRLDVDSAAELAGGFPTSRAELFAYRALVLSNIEASFFTHDQLQLINEFVAKRGGGLLMVGGANSFAEGGWAGTPVAEALPLELERGGGARKFIQLRATPTRAGLLSPITRLRAQPDSSQARWTTLPQLSTANVTGGLKPGATALLSNADTGAIILAQQRYGRGVALAFTPQDSWLWQMHADMSVEDQTHETFWRQLLRYLVQDAASPVQTVAPQVARVGQPLTVSALVEDSAFTGINDATVTARIRSPSGRETEVPASFSGRADGEFTAAATLTEPGMHEITFEAKRGNESIGSSTAHVQAGTQDAEFFDAQPRAATLQRIADETNGRFYTVAKAGSLPDDIGLLGHGETVREQRDLWDMPAIFLLLLMLVSAEWLYRRRKGLV